jgi:hypothetical protein
MEFQFLPRPVFTNLLLADEINRTPPKTQSALLEAMRECRITIAVATRSPIKQETTSIRCPDRDIMGVSAGRSRNHPCFQPPEDHMLDFNQGNRLKPLPPNPWVKRGSDLNATILQLAKARACVAGTA